MFRSFQDRLRVCEAFGIPVNADLTSLILAVWIIFDFGIPLGVPCALILAASIVLHELAHSLVARAFGCRISEIRLSILGGCASGEIPRSAKGEFLVAAAGPAMSFVLAFLAYAVLAVVPMPTRWLANVVYLAFVVNMMLGSFNLLPGFPMDGGRMFRCAMRLFVSRLQATKIAMIAGRCAAVALVVLPLFGIDRLWIIPIGGSPFFRILIAFMIWREGMREYAIAAMEHSWYGDGEPRARVSPPPYGGRGGDCDIERL